MRFIRTKTSKACAISRMSSPDRISLSVITPKPLVSFSGISSIFAPPIFIIFRRLEESNVANMDDPQFIFAYQFISCARRAFEKPTFGVAPDAFPPLGGSSACRRDRIWNAARGKLPAGGVFRLFRSVLFLLRKGRKEPDTTHQKNHDRENTGHALPHNIQRGKKNFVHGCCSSL